MITEVLKYDVKEKTGLITIDDYQYMYDCQYYPKDFSLDEKIHDIESSFDFNKEDLTLLVITFVPEKDDYDEDEWELYKDYFNNVFAIRVIDRENNKILL